MPVLSGGGMRYQQSWTAGEPIDAENQRNLERTVRYAFEHGVNHVETARGYGTSEEQLGRVLPQMPRDALIVQTKIAPTEDPDVFERHFLESLQRLRLTEVELLALHGVNDEVTLDLSLRPGGCLERARDLVGRGLAKSVGFSTHGSVDLVRRAIESDGFDYVNLHYYFVFQRHRVAIDAASARDMGVFIISPNDKGGKLYDPPPQLSELTAPLRPMVFNDIWCLSQPGVHTISIGATRPADYDEHFEAVALLEKGGSEQLIEEIAERLRSAVDAEFGAGWFDTWHEGLPEHDAVPGNVNIQEAVRLYTFARALGLLEYGKMRYNLLGSGGHWFPGNGCENLQDRLADIEDSLRSSPHRAQVMQILCSAHALLAGERRARLQQE